MSADSAAALATVSATRLPPLAGRAANPAAPPLADIVARVRALVPELAARAAETEAARRVSAAITDKLKAAGVYRVIQPARFGGYEYSFAALMDLTFEAGRGCGSTAWCVGLGIVHQWLVGLFPLAAQEEVWAEDTDTLVAGSYAPQCDARAGDGGYWIKGRWGFASNCDNAGWSLVGATLPAGPERARPEPSFLLVPRRDYEILEDWHTLGLAGTGSKTLLIARDVFVPAHRRLTFAEASSNDPPGGRAHANALFRLPFLAAVPTSIVSPAFGMVQGAIEAMIARMGPRVTRGAALGAGLRVAEFPQIQMRLAEATAALDAARLLLYRDIGEIEAAAAEGRFIGLDQRIRNRRDHAFATRLAVQAINAVFDCMGAQGMGLDHPVQRFWRDVHQLAKHMSMNWDWVGAMYGQYHLGLEPKGQF